MERTAWRAADSVRRREIQSGWRALTLPTRTRRCMIVGMVVGHSEPLVYVSGTAAVRVWRATVGGECSACVWLFVSLAFTKTVLLVCMLVCGHGAGETRV